MGENINKYKLNNVTAVKRHFSESKIYPWIVISLCASLLFYKYILSVSPSIMSHELMRQFKVDGAQLGSLAATFFYVYTIVQIFAGVLLDRFGARLIAGFSILISAFGAYLFSIADALWVATIARGMMGFGIAFATVAYFKMTAVWFRADQLAFVGGLLATAVMLGAVFGQAPLAWLLDHTSWRFVLLFCAILGAVIAILYISFAYDAPKRPLGSMLEKAAPIKNKFSLHDIKTAFASKQNWLLTVYSGLAFSPLSVLGGLWGNPFLQEAYNMSRTQAASLVSLMFIGLGIGSPLFGLLSDRLGKRVAIMKLGALLSLVTILLIIYTPMPIWLLGVMIFIFGAATGVFMLGFTVGAQINSLALAATVIALINTGDSIFESFTEPLLGKMLDLSWTGQMLNGVRYFTVENYHTAFVILPLYFVLALILLYFVKEPKKTL